MLHILVFHPSFSSTKVKDVVLLVTRRSTKQLILPSLDILKSSSFNVGCNGDVSKVKYTSCSSWAKKMYFQLENCYTVSKRQSFLH